MAKTLLKVPHFGGQDESIEVVLRAFFTKFCGYMIFLGPISRSMMRTFACGSVAVKIYSVPQIFLAL